MFGHVVGGEITASVTEGASQSGGFYQVSDCREITPVLSVYSGKVQGILSDFIRVIIVVIMTSIIPKFSRIYTRTDTQNI